MQLAAERKQAATPAPDLRPPATAPDAPTAQAPPVAMDGSTPLAAAARRLLPYLKPQRRVVVLSVLAFFAAASLEPLLPAMLAVLIDRGFQPGGGLPAAVVPVAVIGLFALRGLLTFAGQYGFARSTSHAVLKLRSDVIGAVMRADASLYAALSPGVAAARVIHDPQNAVTALMGASTSLLRDGVTLIALLGYLGWLNWRLTLASLVTAPLLALVVRRVQRRVIATGSRSYEAQVRLTGIVDDIARAWRVVRSFDAASFETRRFGEEAERLRRQTLKSVTAGALMTPLTQLVASTGVALILTLALIDARQGGTTVGEFVAFLTALLMTIAPLRRLTDVTQPIVGGLIQARACFALIDTPPEPDTGTRDIEAARGELRFERASVAYPGAERPALHEVDLHIEAGSTVALVGPSGSGKSTLVSTLLGFVGAQSGSVRLDGIELASLRKASLRRQFAVVSQDIVLFDGPLADNVAYAQPRDDARVEACLRAADLHAFVQTLPEGLNTLIGVNGSRLSGGQRQRLAIARALYKDARVWVFDEATSALDSESERAVHEAIARWRGERTLILIAHRLSTVRHADAIHVMAQGRIAESGRHEALMTQGGLYAAMVRAQSVE